VERQSATSDPVGAKPEEEGPTWLRRIVVGVDGSAGARVALVWALAEAARRGVEVEAVAAFPVDLYWSDPYLIDAGRIDAVRADTQSRARALVDEVRRDPAAAVPGGFDVPVHVVVVAGAPAEQLVDRAGDADLLVVGSRGRGGVRSALLGSVALHCAARARCSVVVVHPASSGTVGPVVVGLDGSEPSRAALSTAADQAAGLGVDVVAVVAHERPNHWSDLYAVPAPATAEIHERALGRGEQLVADVLGAGAAEKQPAVRILAKDGPAGNVLVEQAEGASLLVVGSRGASRLAGLALGSVALHCVVHARCPVMVVRPALPPRDSRPLSA
jgi:nucleotide-binding universal stress UspA family protein